MGRSASATVMFGRAVGSFVDVKLLFRQISTLIRMLTSTVVCTATSPVAKDGSRRQGAFQVQVSHGSQPPVKPVSGIARLHHLCSYYQRERWPAEWADGFRPADGLWPRSIKIGYGEAFR